MNRILQAPGTIVLLGGVMFFVTMFVVFRAVKLGTPELPPKLPVAAEDNPSWKYRNPEIDQWIAQIKEERDALALRTEQLKEWEARLAAENRDIATVTQTVSQVQADFDKRVLLFKEQEKDNVKRQVKVVADMSPTGAATMFNEMTDDEVTKLLYLMKPDISAPILDAMSQQGDANAARAAILANRLRDVLNVPATNTLANANP
jgi:flagellar motility protein MotE (MotC chaperone)